MLTTPHYPQLRRILLSHRLWPTMEQHLSPHCLSQHMAATEQMIQLLPPGKSWLDCSDGRRQAKLHQPRIW